MRGLALAFSLLTVLPVRATRDARTPDTRTAAHALRWAPLVGALLGAVTGAVVLGLRAAGAPPLVAGLLGVGACALLTRGMHLDGLADTADGLGCYGPPERALAVMRDGGAGPFGVGTLIVVLGAQAAALGSLPAGLIVPAAALAAATGRAGFCWIARRGVAAARPGGLGAMVARSQPAWVAPLWWLTLAALWRLVGAAAATPAVGWQGVAGVGLAAALTAGLSWHTTRRFGGMTGDVLGATAELATLAVLVSLSLQFSSATAAL